jgi:hypothetical protein
VWRGVGEWWFRRSGVAGLRGCGVAAQPHRVRARPVCHSERSEESGWMGGAPTSVLAPPAHPDSSLTLGMTRGAPFPRDTPWCGADGFETPSTASNRLRGRRTIEFGPPTISAASKHRIRSSPGLLRPSKYRIRSSHGLLRPSKYRIRSSHGLLRPSNHRIRSSHGLLRPSNCLRRPSHCRFRSIHCLRGSSTISEAVRPLRGTSTSAHVAPSCRSGS